ncbi:MAG: sugar-binding protein, partial [Stomatobaculum longum]
MKKAISIIAAVAMATTMLAACGGGSKSESSSAASTAAAGSESSASGNMTAVANKDKPLVWYNRQPSNSSTGELDKDALHFNDKTYYVGFDANQGAELQGQMIVDYIKKHAAEIDKNGDGTIGYVLAIGDIGHNDSIARTRGVRKALGTAVEKDGAIDSTPAGTNVDGTATVVKDGELEVDGKTYKVRERASQEM